MTPAEQQLLTAAERLYRLIWDPTFKERFETIRRESNAALARYESLVPQECEKRRKAQAVTDLATPT